MYQLLGKINTTNHLQREHGATLPLQHTNSIALSLYDQRVMRPHHMLNTRI